MSLVTVLMRRSSRTKWKYVSATSAELKFGARSCFALARVRPSNFASLWRCSIAASIRSSRTLDASFSDSGTTERTKSPRAIDDAWIATS